MRYAVVIPADQSQDIKTVEFPSGDATQLKTIRESIGCSYVDAAALPKAEALAWFDDEGLINRATLNVRASWVTEHGGWGPLLGDVLFTSKEGGEETVGLTSETAEQLVTFAGTAPVLSDEQVDELTQRIYDQADGFTITTWE